MIYLWVSALDLHLAVDRFGASHETLSVVADVVGWLTAALVAAVVVTGLVWSLCSTPCRRPPLTWVYIYVVLMVLAGVLLPAFGQ